MDNTELLKEHQDERINPQENESSEHKVSQQSETSLKNKDDKGSELSIVESAEKMHWMQLVNESVHTSDDIDIGDIDAVSRDFLVVKRGYVNVHYYYILIIKVDGWDGHLLWLKIEEEEVTRKYERDIIPDPSRYYVKDYPFYKASYYPEVIMIQPRHKRPVFTTPPAHGIQTVFKCDPTIDQ